VQLAIVNTRKDYVKSILIGKPLKLSQLRKSQNIQEFNKGLMLREMIVRRRNSSDLPLKKPRLRK